MTPSSPGEAQRRAEDLGQPPERLPERPAERPAELPAATSRAAGADFAKLSEEADGEAVFQMAAVEARERSTRRASSVLLERPPGFTNGPPRCKQHSSACSK